MISKLMDLLNDLRPKQIFLLAGGVTVLMFAAAYFALYTLTQKEEGTSPAASQAEVRTKSVIVAKKDISAHTLLKEDMLQVKQMPADLAPLGALATMKDAVGRTAGVNMYVGDVVTEQKTHEESMSGRFTDSIPVDCRAVSVGIGNVTGVAGFAKAGDYVDVILVQKDDHSAVSTLILQNVLLLSINKHAEKDEAASSSIGAAEAEAKAQMESHSAEDPAIATLALKPREAMELISADALGEIYLALRPSRPKEARVAETDYTMYGLAKPAAPAVSAPVPAPAPVLPAAEPASAEEPPAGGFEIIQGDKILQK